MSRGQLGIWPICKVPSEHGCPVPVSLQGGPRSVDGRLQVLAGDASGSTNSDAEMGWFSRRHPTPDGGLSGAVLSRCFSATATTALSICTREAGSWPCWAIDNHRRPVRGLGSRREPKPPDHKPCPSATPVMRNRRRRDPSACRLTQVRRTTSDLCSVREHWPAVGVLQGHELQGRVTHRDDRLGDVAGQHHPKSLPAPHASGTRLTQDRLRIQGPSYARAARRA